MKERRRHTDECPKRRDGYNRTLIIWFVGLYSLFSLSGSFLMFFFLAAKAKTIPTDQVPLLMALSGTGGAAVTGLLGLLGRTGADDAATRGTPGDPVATTVQNPPSQPVPVAQAEPPQP